MKKIHILILIALLLLLPLFTPEYWLFIFCEILIMGFFATSFNLLFGYTGLLSFGQAGFFGIGAYSVAILIQNGFSFIPLLLFAGMFFAALVSIIVGALSVRHDQIFFGMITLAFGMMLYTIAHNWTSFTGGSDGLAIVMLPSVNIFGKELLLCNPLTLYYFNLAIVVPSILLLYMITVSPFGLLLKGIRENKERLSFSGGNISIIRLTAFFISSAFAGLAGALYALFSSMATPEFLHWGFSAKPVIISILGGFNLFLGPFLGSAIFFLLEQFVRQYTDSWMIFLGGVLLIIVLFAPEGIAGLVIKFFKKRE